MAVLYAIVFFFFFKQKTAYEMRISDWSSDVCSSDLIAFELVLDRDDAGHAPGNRNRAVHVLQRRDRSGQRDHARGYPNLHTPKPCDFRAAAADPPANVCVGLTIGPCRNGGLRSLCRRFCPCLCRRSILSDRFLAGKENEHGEPKGDRRKRGPKSGTGDAPWGREDQHVHLTRNRADCRVVVHHFGADCGPAPEGGIPAIPWYGPVQPGLRAS